MLKRFRPPLAWLAGLLLASLWLAGCGGAAQSTAPSPEQAGSNQTTAAIDASCDSTSSTGCAETPTAQTEASATTPATDEVDQAATTSEEAVAAETPASTVAAASPTTQVATASKQAVCQAIEIPTNAAVSPVSDNDWSKGPANAPITLIEYGDFQ